MRRRERRALLATYEGPAPDRVCHAIELLADGDDDTLRSLLATARRDYRDVLAWAEQRRTGRAAPEVDVAGILAALGGAELDPSAASSGSVDVVVVSVGSRPADVVKVCRRATGLGLDEVRVLLGALPCRVRTSLAAGDAAGLAARLESAGATVRRP